MLNALFFVNELGLLFIQFAQKCKIIQWSYRLIKIPMLSYKKFRTYTQVYDKSTLAALIPHIPHHSTYSDYKIGHWFNEFTFFRIVTSIMFIIRNMFTACFQTVALHYISKTNTHIVDGIYAAG